MQGLGLATLGIAAVALTAGAFRITRTLAPGKLPWLTVATLLAIPMGWIGILSFADGWLVLTAPVAPESFLAFVGIGVVALVAFEAAAVLMPERFVFGAAAIAPLAAIALASLKPATTVGGGVSMLLGLVMIASATILPRGAALAAGDRSRAFPAIVIALALVLGGAFGALLGTAAVREGGLGLAEGGRAFEVVVTPSFDERFSVELPLPSSANETTAPLVAAWLAELRVVEGDATARVANGSLIVEGAGRVVVRAAYAFHAPTEMRANLTHVEATTPDARVIEAPEGGAVTVAWRAEASIEGAQCASRETGATLAVNQTATLFERPQVWPDVARCES